MKITELTLLVNHREAARVFYESLLGLETVTDTPDLLQFAADPAFGPLITVKIDPNAPHRPVGTTGLFHFALLYPTRKDLGRSIRHLIEKNYPLQGASHHGVSEAIYLADPFGTGVELYHDLPREEWPYTSNGELAMVTEGLNLESLLKDAGEPEDDFRATKGVTIGHLHLQVSKLSSAEEFYCTMLGFSPTQRSYPGALFVGYDGYHHHFGLNIWGGKNAPPPPPDAQGLKSFTIRVSSYSRLQEMKRRAEAAGLLEQEKRPEFVADQTPQEREQTPPFSFTILDQDRNSVTLTAAR